MNIIFSEETDFSTNYLIDWFIYFNEHYLRYNGASELNKENNLFSQESSIHINNENGKSLYIKREKISNINSIYFRRPYSGYKDFYVEYENKVDENLAKYINDKIKKFSMVLKKSIIGDLLVNTKNILGGYEKTNLNKLLVLEKAVDSGLNIPKTIITSSYYEITQFYNACNKKIICKSIEEVLYYKSNYSNKIYSTKTNLIDNISKIKKYNISLSLFQEYIEKEYEIRIFFLNKQFYSCAIFSQQNPKTKVDFRNYDENNPNKMVPYILEDSIKNKIINLMESLDLNLGSIDLLKALDGNYYFLEINPVGQYDFVSKRCGYYLDYKIAKYLIDER